jgi:hypothetical protein
MKKKIGVVIIYKFNLNDYNIFNFKRLTKLFDVSFFDISNFFLENKIVISSYKKNSLENKIKNYFILKNTKDLRKKIKNFDFILDFSFLFLKNSYKKNKIRKYLYEINKIKNIKKIVILSGTLPNFFNHKLTDKFRFFFIILYFIFNNKKYSFILFYIKKIFYNLKKIKKNNIKINNKFHYDYVMISDIFWEKFTDSYFPEAKKVHVHYKDYEKYLFFKNNNKIVIKDYVVFLDEDIFDHPDNFDLYQSFSNNNKESLKQQYFSSLNKFFCKFEQSTSLKIIIAAHPKTLLTKENNSFQNRSFVKNKTFDLIKNSKGVFAHSSTSISMAVLLNKPLTLLFSKVMFDLGYVHRMLSFLIETKAQFVDIETSNINYLDFVKKNSKNSYASYINKYIKYKPTEKFSMWNKLYKILKYTK